MATMITAECINCGACEPECPNTAIYQGGVEWAAPDGATHGALSNDIFYIVPEKCTECVGFFDHEACAAVCPVDCCVPNPQIPETEGVLLARARVLHPDKTLADDAPSRFRKEVGDGAAAAPAEVPPPTAAAAAPLAESEIAYAPEGLAVPPLEEWEIPITCFRCNGEYTVPFPSYRAGTVFRCPHCLASLVPTLPMVREVSAALEKFHTTWSETFERFHERRQRELEQFEERQRRTLEQFEKTLRRATTNTPPPGAPRARRGFFRL